MLDSFREQLTPLANLNEELEKLDTLTKRLSESPLPELPMVEPSLATSSGLTSAKRRRRTRYKPIAGDHGARSVPGSVLCVFDLSELGATFPSSTSSLLTSAFELHSCSSLHQHFLSETCQCNGVLP